MDSETGKERLCTQVSGRADANGPPVHTLALALSSLRYTLILLAVSLLAVSLQLLLGFVMRPDGLEHLCATHFARMHAKEGHAALFGSSSASYLAVGSKTLSIHLKNCIIHWKAVQSSVQDVFTSYPYLIQTKLSLLY